MRNLVWVLIGLSALGFVLAVVAVLLRTNILLVSAEGFSRACTNLALIAISLLLAWKKEGKE